MIIIVTTMTIMVMQVDFTTKLVYSPEGTQLATIRVGFFSPSILPRLWEKIL